MPIDLTPEQMKQSILERKSMFTTGNLAQTTLSAFIPAFIRYFYNRDTTLTEDPLNIFITPSVTIFLALVIYRAAHGTIDPDDSRSASLAEIDQFNERCDLFLYPRRYIKNYATVFLWIVIDFILAFWHHNTDKTKQNSPQDLLGWVSQALALPDAEMIMKVYDKNHLINSLIGNGILGLAFWALTDLILQYTLVDRQFDRYSDIESDELVFFDDDDDKKEIHRIDAAITPLPILLALLALNLFNPYDQTTIVKTVGFVGYSIYTGY